MSCHKCLIFSTLFTQTFNVMSHISDIQYSCHTVMLCHVTNAWYPVIMSHRHVTSCHKYLILITNAKSHVMSQMTDIHYSCHKDMIWHKWLIFSKHAMESCHIMSQMSDIQYTCHTVISCHTYLLFSTHVK